MLVPHRRAFVLSAAVACALTAQRADVALAADVLWDAGQDPSTGSRFWTTASNWDGNVVPGAADTAVFGPGPSAGIVNVGSFGAPNSGTQVVDGIRFTAASELYTLNSGALRLNRIELLGDASAVSNVGHVVNCGITTSDTQLTLLTENLNGAIPLSLNGAIGIGGGSPQTFSLAKQGAGTAYLRGNSLYTGATTVQNGTLAFRGANGRASATSSVEIGGRGTLVLSGADGKNNTRLNDAAAINLAHGGTFILQGAADVLTSERVGTITLTGGASSIQLEHGGGTGSSFASLSAPNFVRTNRATVDMTGTNLGRGLTTLGTRFGLDSGVIPEMVGGFATGGTMMAVVPFISSGKFGVTYNLNSTFDGAPTGFRPLHSDEYANFFTTGSNPQTNVLINNNQSMGNHGTINSLVLDMGGNLSGGTYILSVTSGAVHGAGGQFNAGGMSFGFREGFFHAASGNTTINAGVQGSNGVTKGGPGEITWSANNTYTGPTTINDGTLTIKHAQALPSGSEVTVYGSEATPTRLKFTRFFDGEQQRTYTNPIHLRGNGTVAISHDLAPIAAPIPGNVSLMGAIDGTATLLLDGGPVTLGAANTHTGGTRLAGSGGVRLGTDQALGTGALTVAAGTTGSIRAFGPGVRTIANDVISEGTLIFAGPGSLTFTGDVSAVSREITVTSAGSATPISLTGTLTSTGAGPWSLGGISGTLRLAPTTPVQGGFDIKAGTLVVGANAIDGTIRLGNTTGVSTSGLFSDVVQTIANNVIVDGGSTGTLTMGARHTSGTTTYNGTITLGSSPAGTPTARNLTIAAATGGDVDITGTLQDADVSTTADVTIGTSAMRGLVRFDSPAGISYKGATHVRSGNLLIAPGTTMASKVYSAGLGALTVEGNIPDDSSISVPGSVNNGVINFTKTETIESLSLASNGVANVAAGGGNTLVTKSMLLLESSQLRMNDNDFIVDYAQGETSPEMTLRNHVKTFADNAAATTGITYTRGANDRTLAVAEKTEWGQSMFNGFTLDDTTVIGKYTYFGDANLDGKVDSNDYVAVDVGLGTGDSWVQGDFNFDGKVDSNDYVAIDTNLGKGVTIGDPLAIAELKAEMVALHTAMFGSEYGEKLAYAEANGFGATFVPEPSAMGIVAGLAILSRRQRRRV